MLSFAIYPGDIYLSESSGLFQCSLELTGSVDLYEHGLPGDVDLFHPVDYLG